MDDVVSDRGRWPLATAGVAAVGDPAESAAPAQMPDSLGGRLLYRCKVIASLFAHPDTQYPAVTGLVLLILFFGARDVLFADFSRVFLPLGSTFSLASLAMALVLAVAFLAARRWARGRRVGFRLMVRALFPARILRSASTRADIGFFVLNHTVNAALFGWALLSHNTINHWVQAFLPDVLGLPRLDVDPLIGKLILTFAIFLAYEFAYWFDHYLAHEIPVLWEFHRIHHTAEVLSPLTGARVHPVSTVIYYNIAAVTVGLTSGSLCYLLDLSNDTFVLGGANIIAVAFLLVTFHLQHSHVWIPFTGVLGRLVASPAHHQIHHSQDPAHFGKNLGGGLALWDWLFGTLLIPSRTPQKLVFGVTAERGERPHTFVGGMIRPFGRALVLLATVVLRPFRSTAAVVIRR